MSTDNPQGFGYAISGTTKDGPHFHSGILGFNFTDPKGVLGCANCQVSSADSGQRGPTTVVYTLSDGGTTAGLLKDPMWYLAKYGAFDERKSPAADRNGLPNLPREWDNTLTDGLPGEDGIPDNYFLVTNPHRTRGRPGACVQQHRDRCTVLVGRSELDVAANDLAHLSGALRLDRLARVSGGAASATGRHDRSDAGLERRYATQRENRG